MGGIVSHATESHALAGRWLAMDGAARPDVLNEGAGFDYSARGRGPTRRERQRDQTVWSWRGETAFGAEPAPTSDLRASCYASTLQIEDRER
jgi:hypothetical protein